MLIYYSNYSSAFRLFIFASLSNWWSANAERMSHYLLKAKLTAVIVCSRIFWTKTWKLTIAFKLQGALLYNLFFTLPLEAFLGTLSGNFCAEECDSSPSSRRSRNPAVLPALSLLSGPRTVGLWKLMVHALLPGQKMDWNVVYLKHTRLQQDKTWLTEPPVWD